MEKMYIFKYLSIQIFTFKKNDIHKTLSSQFKKKIAFLFKITDICIWIKKIFVIFLCIKFKFKVCILAATIIQFKYRNLIRI